MKSKVLLLLTLVTFLTACETNDNSNITITKADLVGTWNLKSQIVEDGSFNATIQGQNISATYSALATDINFTYTFSEDPNKVELQGKYKFTATTNFFGQTETEVQEINTDLIAIPSASWSLNGESITINEDNNSLPTILNVVEFSSNYIKLKGELNQTETDNGESVTIKGTLYIELEK